MVHWQGEWLGDTVRQTNQGEAQVEPSMYFWITGGSKEWA